MGAGCGKKRAAEVFREHYMSFVFMPFSNAITFGLQKAPICVKGTLSVSGDAELCCTV